jgi:hypothetical protein
MGKGSHYKQGGRQDQHILDEAMRTQIQAKAAAAKELPQKIGLMEPQRRKEGKKDIMSP